MVGGSDRSKECSDRSKEGSDRPRKGSTKAVDCQGKAVPFAPMAAMTLSVTSSSVIFYDNTQKLTSIFSNFLKFSARRTVSG